MPTAQLHLINANASGTRWSLDARTRQVGRAGIAAAREALRNAAEKQAA